MNPQEYEIMFRIEDGYWWYKGIRAIANSVLEKYLPVKSGLKILDAGCGTGGNLEMLGRFGNVYGLELTREGAFFLRKRSFYRFATASATEIPYADSIFDLVTVFYVNECLPNDAPAFREYFRVLKPGGRFYTSEVAFESLRGEHDLAVGILHRYTRRDLNRRLEAAGFIVEKSSYINTLLFPPIYMLRKFRSIFRPVSGREEAHSDFDLAPGPLHGIFEWTLNVEARLVRHINLPFGVSVLSLARKPEK